MSSNESFRYVYNRMCVAASRVSLDGLMIMPDSNTLAKPHIRVVSVG